MKREKNENKKSEYDDQLIAAYLKITGRVQGVAFRYYARSMANQLDVKGWIRNLSNGKVELVVEGKKKAIKRMIKWCHSGPSMARVDRIQLEWGKYTGQFNQFSVRG